MWVTESSCVTKANASTVWNRLIDVGTWHVWDKSKASSSLDGSFRVGAIGTVNPAKEKAWSFEITEILPDRSFSAVGTCWTPLTTINFSWSIEPTGTGQKITGRVTMQGLLSWFWGWMIGSAIEKTLPIAVETLARQAEVDELLRQDELRMTQQ